MYKQSEQRFLLSFCVCYLFLSPALFRSISHKIVTCSRWMFFEISFPFIISATATAVTALLLNIYLFIFLNIKYNWTVNGENSLVFFFYQFWLVIFHRSFFFSIIIISLSLSLSHSHSYCNCIMYSSCFHAISMFSWFWLYYALSLSNTLHFISLKSVCFVFHIHLHTYTWDAYFVHMHTYARIQAYILHSIMYLCTRRNVEKKQ